MKMTKPVKKRRGGVVVKALAGAAALAAAAGLGYVALAGESGESRTVSASDMATVSKMSFEITTTATGDLQAKSQTVLRSEQESEASIAELAPEGAFVRAGDLLVRLNVDQVQTQLDEAELRVASSKSDLVAADKGFEIQESENESTIRQALLKLDMAQLALDQWEKGERVQKLKDIELDLDRTLQDLERLKEKFVQSEKLFAEGFLSKNDLDLDRIALREADAARAKALLEQDTYNNYQLPKDRKQKTSDVEEARAELDRTRQKAEIQLAIKAADRFNRKRQLALHEEKRDKLARQVNASIIRAPQDGLVVYATSAGRNWRDDSPFVVGRKVFPQEELIVLPDTGVMVAAVRVHETLAGRIRPGQPATVKIDAYPGRTFTGEVDSIGVMADTQGRWMDPNRREYTIKIAIDRVEAEVALKPSMRCEATITLGSVEDAPTVPLQAVFSDEAVRFVYAPRGGQFVRVPVQVGRRSETLAEISAGIEVGAKVLVREPGPGEVARTPWDADQLKLVGLKVGDDGKPVPLAGESGRQSRRGPGRGAPKAPAPAVAEAPATPPDAEAPAEPAAAPGKGAQVPAPGSSK